MIEARAAFARSSGRLSTALSDVTSGGLDTMAHTRIRKFNTKDTYPEQALNNEWLVEFDATAVIPD